MLEALCSFCLSSDCSSVLNTLARSIVVASRIWNTGSKASKIKPDHHQHHKRRGSRPLLARVWEAAGVLGDRRMSITFRSFELQTRRKKVTRGRASLMVGGRFHPRQETRIITRISPRSRMSHHSELPTRHNQLMRLKTTWNLS